MQICLVFFFSQLSCLANSLLLDHSVYFSLDDGSSSRLYASLFDIKSENTDSDTRLKLTLSRTTINNTERYAHWSWQF